MVNRPANWIRRFLGVGGSADPPVEKQPRQSPPTPQPRKPRRPRRNLRVSARAQAFAAFDNGFRPSELRYLGVKPESLYRYFQDWKHQADKEEERKHAREIRGLALTAEVAEELGVTETELEVALRARNPKAAVNQAVRGHITTALEAAEVGQPFDRKRLLGRLRTYRGRDKEVLLARAGRVLRSDRGTKTSENPIRPATPDRVPEGKPDGAMADPEKDDREGVASPG